MNTLEDIFNPGHAMIQVHRPTFGQQCSRLWLRLLHCRRVGPFRWPVLLLLAVAGVVATQVPMDREDSRSVAAPAAVQPSAPVRAQREGSRAGVRAGSDPTPAGSALGRRAPTASAPAQPGIADSPPGSGNRNAPPPPSLPGRSLATAAGSGPVRFVRIGPLETAEQAEAARTSWAATAGDRRQVQARVVSCSEGWSLEVGPFDGCLEAQAGCATLLERYPEYTLYGRQP